MHFKKYFLYTILLLLQFTTSFAEPGDWLISSSKDNPDQYMLRNGVYSFEIDDVQFEPKIIDVKKRRNLELIIIHARTNGTFFMLQEYDAVIFDSINKKFLGAYPFKQILISKNPEGYEVNQPEWTFTKDFLHIVETEYGIDEKIYYPK